MAVCLFRGMVLNGQNQRRRNINVSPQIKNLHFPTKVSKNNKKNYIRKRFKECH